MTAGLLPDAVRRIRARFDRIAPGTFSQAFFECLFEAHPEVRALMPLDLASHGEYVEAAVAVVIRNLADLSALERPLEELGEEHARRGIGPDQLGAAEAVLVRTVERLSVGGWSSQDEDEWATAFRALLAPMRQGAARAAGAAGTRPT